MDSTSQTKGVRFIPDAVFSRVGGIDRLVDLYLPEGTGPFPAVIYLHGGGWRFGDRRLGPDLSRHFASQGYAMVSIDYRLSGEALFPAAVIDTKTAVRWLRTHAADYNIDPNRIAYLGSSAGGHLAALAALCQTDFASEEWAGVSEAVQVVVEGYGPTDLSQIDAHRDPDALPGTDPESAHLPPSKPLSDPASLEAQFIGGPIPDMPQVVARANPCNYTRKDAPPFLILHGDYDSAIPLHQSRLLHNALRSAAAQSTLGVVHGKGHGFLNRTGLDDETPTPVTLDTPDGVDHQNGVWQVIKDFLDQHL